MILVYCLAECGTARSPEQAARLFRRGLCDKCRRMPNVVRLFAPPSSQQFRSDMPAVPTSATPGSERKIQVMTFRAAMGQAIFHPDDPTNALTMADLSRHGQRATGKKCRVRIHG